MGKKCVMNILDSKRNRYKRKEWRKMQGCYYVWTKWHKVEDIEKPKCPPNGLIFKKFLSIGLCGSDIRNMTTDSCKGKYPHIFGHEIVGMVDEIDINTPKI